MDNVVKGGVGAGNLEFCGPQIELRPHQNPYARGRINHRSINSYSSTTTTTSPTPPLSILSRTGGCFNKRNAAEVNIWTIVNAFATMGEAHSALTRHMGNHPYSPRWLSWMGFSFSDNSWNFPYSESEYGNFLTVLTQHEGNFDSVFMLSVKKCSHPGYTESTRNHLKVSLRQCGMTVSLHSWVAWVFISSSKLCGKGWIKWKLQ